MSSEELPLQRQFLRYSFKAALGTAVAQKEVARVIGRSIRRVSLWYNHEDPSLQSLRVISKSIHATDNQQEADEKADAFATAFLHIRGIDQGKIGVHAPTPADAKPFFFSLGFLDQDGQPTDHFVDWLARRNAKLECPSLDVPPEPTKVVLDGKLELRSRRTVPTERFVGRAADIAAIEKLLEIEDRVLVVGEPGMGKSSICKQMCEKLQSKYPKIWLVDTRNHLVAVSSLSDLCDELPLDIDDSVSAKVKARLAIEYIERSPTGWLLVLEDFSGGADVQELVPRGATILAASRLVNKGYEVYRLSGLDAQSSIDLLAAFSEREFEGYEALELAKVLDGNPLGLAIAGSWLKSAPSVSPKSYISKIEQIVSIDPKRLGIGDYSQTISAAVFLTAMELSEDAKFILNLSSWLDGTSLSSLMFQMLALRGDEREAGHEHFGPLPDRLWELSIDPARLQLAISEIIDVSLAGKISASETELAFFVHNLIQASVKHLELQYPGRSQYWENVTASFISGIFPSDPSSIYSFELCERLLPHCELLFGYSSIDEAGDFVLNNAATTLRRMGLKERSRQYLLRACELVEQRRGRVHQESVRVRCNLFMAAIDAGDYHMGLWDGFSVISDAWRLQKAKELSAREYSVCISNFANSIKTVAKEASSKPREQMLGVAAKLDSEAILVCRNNNLRQDSAYFLPIVGLAGTRLLQRQERAAFRLFGYLTTFCVREAKDDLTRYKLLIPFAKAMISCGFTVQGYKSLTPLEVLSLCDLIIQKIRSRQVLQELYDLRDWSVACHLVLARMDYRHPYLSIDHMQQAVAICDHMGFDISDYNERVNQYVAANERKLLL